MNRTIRAVIGAILVLVIAFSAISISQNLTNRLKLDLTGQKLYTLSDGTRAILAKLHQPVKAKLYYAKTAALKAPDQIRYFNNYYEFVKALLEEYTTAAKGMVELEIIDPRPFSKEEEQALQYGLKRFPITREENFFFGLVVQTQFGVEKTIPFFSPDRQNFVEYDISYLIDTAVTRQKKRIGVISSLPVMGQDVTPYMARLMQIQNQRPKPPWTIITQLRKQCEVKQVPIDVNDIEDVDILIVIHPKDLPKQTLFAIDQFVLKGGRTIVCVDPHCFADRPDRMALQMGSLPSQSSDLNVLLRTWGLEMPAGKFAGDRSLALPAPQSQENIIGFLDLTPKCFNHDSVVTAHLNKVVVLFAGVLNEVDKPDDAEEGKLEIERTPLVMTTKMGNTFSVTSPYELIMLDAKILMDRFFDGSEPVPVAYLVTGRFKSSFPDGIEIEVEQESGDPNEDKKTTKLTGLKEAAEDCAVVVFADVDFISDGVAYREFLPFGMIAFGDNSTLLLNTIDDLGGSSDLISIRSRGNFQRPFTVVDEIERQADSETAAEVAKINMQIEGFNRELQSIVASAQQGQEDIVGSTIMQKKRELELKLHQANREKRSIQMKRRERIEHLGNALRQANMLAAPIVILIIAVVLSIRRSARKRHYISHASDA